MLHPSSLNASEIPAMVFCSSVRFWFCRLVCRFSTRLLSGVPVSPEAFVLLSAEVSPLCVPAVLSDVPCAVLSADVCACAVLSVSDEGCEAGPEEDLLRL